MCCAEITWVVVEEAREGAKVGERIADTIDCDLTFDHRLELRLLRLRLLHFDSLLRFL